MRADRAQSSMETAFKNRLSAEKQRLGAAAGRLNALSPLSVLERGYSVAVSEGSAVRRLGDVVTGGEIRTIVSDGVIRSIVTDKEEKSI